jgi:hypothetical protein
MIQQTDEVHFTSNHVTQYESTSPFFKGKFCIASDRPMSIASAAITTSADGIFELAF